MSEQQNDRDKQVKTFEAPSAMIAAVREVADATYDGNFSQAVRALLRRGLTCVCDDHSNAPGRPVTEPPVDPSFRTVNATAGIENRQGGKRS